MKHISHPGHLLELKEDNVIRENAMCYVCNKTVIGTPTYTCTSKSVSCQSFYLHKSCAELPPKINHNKHRQHPLAYLPCEGNFCDVCYCYPKFAYSCLNSDCDFDVCLSCAFEERMYQHEGHAEHTLTLVQRVALFTCDACGEEDKDLSYICNVCQFWIHRRCASSPLHISVLAYHHHPLTLIYAIPDMHRYFSRYCTICDEKIHVNMWMYYCHRCTYFVHMKCAASSETESMLNEINSGGIEAKLADLVRFPRRSEESVFELILTQCEKFRVEVQGKGKNSITVSTIPSDPHTIEEHWSHKIHPLELLRFTISEDDDIDDSQTLICDGCIQPITVFHPYYYACNQCNFFLHSFCAIKLPMELPAGASLCHPQHLLLLRKRDIFYELVECGVCAYFTNGFYYECETCDFKVEIRCAFAPLRINHTSHRHYSLIKRPFSGSRCNLCRFNISEGIEYACETCDKFHIHWQCALYPSQMKHKYDPHSVTLEYPPFFYEGVFHCEHQVWRDR
ncbi:uncharacterized protein LOC108206806 isoform X2 [Daucus carota subsp. sativus]|uniref:uncharacterized protein LOC108206806 isoform X2 n=1 Tax=Daucus carota subsp. sativus TaxID=79200 RepID=UPI0007EFE612|nr:PREDICTED: uncharacterized protein LOC108206806 isoform X3 [Daucus carota subsp. sativus]